ncbi:hypothetical protein DNX69_11920 [Rhodopseudomonas palustris]|uniref:Uncharacterized protein n=1 Tax=Rhodopseudomonas palustris TaxID=1076 RepID=A0A323ULE2_RHOPL|nr:hypothetical protein DNX69_11920 [Rhodopseudomonas palustris]
MPRRFIGKGNCEDACEKDANRNDAKAWTWSEFHNEAIEAMMPASGLMAIAAAATSETGLLGLATRQRVFASPHVTGSR